MCSDVNLCEVIMTKWEYRNTGLVVKCEKPEALVEFLNECGRDGWEVCSAIRDLLLEPGDAMWSFILKRPTEII